MDHRMDDIFINLFTFTIMKIETTKQVKTEVEIELPYYCANMCHFYEVYSEQRCIQVCTLEDWNAISIQPAKLALNGENNRVITEKEFSDIFEITLAKIRTRP